MASHKSYGSRLTAKLGSSVVTCVLILVLCALWASACAKAQARTPTEGPPLIVPDPPARVLAPVEPPEPIAAAIPEAPTPAPPPPATRPPTRRPAPAAADAEPPRPEPAVPTVVQPVTPAPTLRAAPSAADATAERAVRDTLSRAARDLSRVDYGRLSSDGRAQYEQSKRFTAQAEQALKDLNFPFAATLADKAATLAAELSP
jgi:type IV secretory pathway VirB10-like protein